ncbi:MAG TPA: 3-hydroxyacyl-CoA dehydrogenase family protein, partial [Pilimelia sp.]|nr:3-hydroxyacyl-CoA dehydrogenase family protein [Pilimelia sp.]
GLRLTLTGAGAALAELAGTVRSAPSALAAARGAAAAIGATVVECRDRAGFLVDGLLLPYLNDAVRMLAAGYATADDIDVAMTLGCGYPAGPIAMLDALGAPAALAGQAAIHRELGEPGMAPEPLLAQVAAAGLGARAAARTLVG